MGIILRGKKRGVRYKTGALGGEARKESKGGSLARGHERCTSVEQSTIVLVVVLHSRTQSTRAENAVCEQVRWVECFRDLYRKNQVGFILRHEMKTFGEIHTPIRYC